LNRASNAGIDRPVINEVHFMNASFLGTGEDCAPLSPGQLWKLCNSIVANFLLRFNCNKSATKINHFGIFGFGTQTAEIADKLLIRYPVLPKRRRSYGDANLSFFAERIFAVYDL
jgi:hypothetical protein